ncbi:MAG TPA: beta-ketoacyl synthase N-terminal-like domain-containing protein [Luteolibacter sp.]|nr:beta-ketoacyl synthase N-terminal-like domain-containing protein [Luteolibacter sp.]
MGALTAYGAGAERQRAAILAQEDAFRPLGELLGGSNVHAARPGAWIEDRASLINRKWSPATMAALRVARQAVEQAGWTPDECRDAALLVGTSRGNAAGWLEAWPGRRPFKLMAASNTMHGESVSAISIELGIAGPNHVLATGCAAGLDALGVAMLLLRGGFATRALVVAVDLPLVTPLLDHYAAAGILSSNPRLDPYAPDASGFVPAEGAAAMAIECGAAAGPKLLEFRSNSDACDPIGIPADGGRTPDLFAGIETPSAVCPHATGTAVQAAADPAALARAFGDKRPTLHLLKPYLGHAIGASGLLEAVVMAEFLRHNELPPNRPGLHAPMGFRLPEQVTPASGPIAKLSHAMGGHNALLTLRS